MGVHRRRNRILFLVFSFFILLWSHGFAQTLSPPRESSMATTAREFILAHERALDHKKGLNRTATMDIKKSQELLRAYSKNKELAQKKHDRLQQMSKDQGTGEITIFFKANSQVIPKNSLEYERLIHFTNFLSRNSRGRRILFICLGSSPSPGEGERILSKQRTRAPISIIDHQLVNIPHTFYEIFDSGEMYCPLTHSKNINKGYRHVRILALYEIQQTNAPRAQQMNYPLPREGWSHFTNSLGMQFIHVPPGSFTMGSPASELRRSKGERQHNVTLTKGFWLMATEVTQAQWVALMGKNPSHFLNCGMDCPVENVRWSDVKEFIGKLNQKEQTHRYRLPTEAEWEYAARAGTATAFHSGPMIAKKDFDTNLHLDRVGWYYRNAKESTHQVAKKLPNGWGFYDMHGNVWEWCDDWQSPYPFHSVVDPAGAASGYAKIRRGGSWAHYPEYCRSAYRSLYESEDRSPEIGFRLAISAQEPMEIEEKKPEAYTPPCVFGLQPHERRHSWQAVKGKVFVLPSNTDCQGTAFSQEPWIHLPHPRILGPSPLPYSLDANSTPTPRRGTIKIGDESFTITQGGKPIARAPKPLEIMPEPGPVGITQCIVVEDIRFTKGRSRIQATMVPILDRAAQILKRQEGTIEICGHTSGLGPVEYNKNLGLKRARAVKQYLAARGIAPARMTTKSMGETQPKYTNKTRPGRRLNRRVEIRLLGAPGE